MSKEMKKRSQLIIHPKFQYTLLITNISIFFTTCLFVLAMTYFKYSSLKEVGKSVNLPDDHVTFKFLNYQYEHFFQYQLIGFIVAGLLSTFVTVWISHKLAGPIVRLKGYFEDLDEGKETPPLKFREGDYLTDLPPVINSVMDKNKK
jgi:hypothetical protein